jgi:hypothetical protein
MRSGDEAQAATRLTHSVHPPEARAVLVRCLSGDLAPAAALAQLYHVTGSAAAVREVVDEVTRNAAAASRSGDRLLQDRVDELTQVVLDPELGLDRLDEMQRRARGSF